MSSSTKAPTFKISNSVANNQLTNLFDVIYSEWIDGWNGLTENTDFSTRMNDSDITTASGGVIYPHIVDTKYSTVAKYNYKDTIASTTATNNEQSFGTAFTFIQSAADCVTTDSANFA